MVIEPALAKGRYLRLQGTTVTVAATEWSSSAFLRRGGLSDIAGVSFESVDVPGAYLVLRQGVLTAARVGKEERASATFCLRS